MNRCEHKRIKKNYPFGRKSKAQKSCRNCGEIITNKLLEKRRIERQRNNSKNGRRK